MGSLAKKVCAKDAYMIFAPIVGLYSVFTMLLLIWHWTVEDGTWICISSDECSTSFHHSLLIIAVNSLMDSLRNYLSNALEGVIGTGGLFWHP
jgi:hypothetical protein